MPRDECACALGGTAMRAMTLRRVCSVLAIVGAGCSADTGDAARPRVGSVDRAAGAASSSPAAAPTIANPAAIPTSSSAGGSAGVAPVANAPAAPTRMIGNDHCAALSQTAQNKLQPADVIWAIDSSGS